jgi:glycosyltransferase involved in cell wall biosynthesis
LSAVSGVSTHLNLLLDSTLSASADLHHFQVGSEGRTESRLGAVARLAASPWQLRRQLSLRGIDIVHVNSSLNKAFWRDCAYVAVARLSRRRVLYQVHGGDLPEVFTASSALKRRVLSVVLRAADLVVLLAEVERHAYARFLPSLPVVVVPNAIPLPPTTPAPPSQVRRQQGVLQLVYVGRLARAKGLVEAVEAVALLRDRGIVVELTLAGSGPDEQVVRDVVHQRALQDRVRLSQPVFGAAKQSLWDQSDVFLFPTYAEGLPYALLEAMAAGTVPITCPTGAIPDVVTDGEDGFLVSPRDAVALADRLQWMDTHRSELTRMGDAAARRVRESYSLERLVRDFAGIYRRLSA